MANPMPCKIHEQDGQQVLADWLVTAQTEVMGFEPGNTFYVCMECLTGLALAWLQANQEPAAEVAEAAPEPVVEDPGTVDMAAWDPPEVPARSRPKRGRQEAEETSAEDGQQAQTADVNG